MYQSTRYQSTRGTTSPASFARAVLNGFADDGGLFVPCSIPELSASDLQQLSSLDYVDLAVRLLRHYIDQDTVPDRDLDRLVDISFSAFTANEIVPLVSPDNDEREWIMELFHGPTLSFKDVAMGFLLNVMDYFLEKQDDSLSLILATTGDTGPAAAYASTGKKRIRCWPLYPAQMISAEQERQMTTIRDANVCPVAVTGCRNGGDDLDVVVASLFSDRKRRRTLKLSSVNSINICRVLMQVVHYFYGYFRVVGRVGDPVVFSVPAGAFGNLCAGEIARSMGLPITFICAVNKNRTLHRIFADGIFEKTQLKQSLSSAIDIVIPYNFYRFLYFRSGGDVSVVKQTMAALQKAGSFRFSSDLHQKLRQGMVSTSISDQRTLTFIRDLFARTGYLIDPHGAVAAAAVEECKDLFAEGTRFISLATAHPAKFPDVVRKALGAGAELPAAALHPSLERAKRAEAKKLTCTCEELEQLLAKEIEASLSLQA